MKTSIRSWGSFLGLLFAFLLSLTLLPSDVIDVSMMKNKITAKQTTLNHDDFISICSRDNDHHQPYSVSEGNKFGSSTAKEKDILTREHCRVEKVKNTKDFPIDMVILDRFNPQASLTLKVLPKPKVAKASKGTAKDTDQTFVSPMVEGQRLDWCYKPQEGCGEKAASSYCQSKGYKQARTFESANLGKSPKLVTRYLGASTTCRRSGCETFKSITCQREPPTFF